MNKAFTLIELMIVISIIGSLTMLGVSAYPKAVKNSRDLQRKSDMNDISAALEQYKQANGDLPNETYTGGNLAGWEVSTFPNFMEYLQPYIHKIIKDPVNRIAPLVDMFYSPRPDDYNFFYMYHYYNQPDAGQRFGCNFDGPLAVFGFRALEHSDSENLPKAQCGPMPCDRGGTPNVCRDWSNEFDYSVIIRP